MPKKCKICNKEGHSQTFCFNKKNKAITKQGKYAKKWLETRNEWIQKNTNTLGVFNCYICGVLLTLETLTLDHKHSRSRRPDLRFDLTNLAPCCKPCNEWKGSREFHQAS